MKIIHNDITQDIRTGKWPKRYRSEFIEPGICDYTDLGAGTIYIGPEALDKMLESFIGKPVVNNLHNDLTPEQAYKISNDDLKTKADGVVYAVGKAENGWHYCDMIVWDEATQKNIKNGHSVSCAYIVEGSGPGGTYHGISYDEEVTDGFYTHNAIVSNPRYERAKIYELPATYQNSVSDELVSIIKNTRGDNMKENVFKHLFNGAKKETSKTPEEKDEKEVMENSIILCNDGTKIPLHLAVNAYFTLKNQASTNAAPEDGKEEDKEMENACDEDKKENASEEEDKEIENAEPAQDETAEKVVENAEQAQDVVAEDVVEKTSTMTNTKEKKSYFKMVKNAAAQTVEDMPLVTTSADRFARGAAKYGSKEAK